MSVLIDSSVWIEYFRNGNNYEKVDFLIDENLVVTNDLILAELAPFLKVRKQFNLIGLLNNISKSAININWDQIIDLQYLCLQNGLNGVGIPDLIIVQNAMQNVSKVVTIQHKLFSSLMKKFLTGFLVKFSKISLDFDAVRNITLFTPDRLLLQHSSTGTHPRV